MGRRKLYQIDDVSMTLPMWCTYVGMNYDTVVHRMKRGMELLEALTAPLMSNAPSHTYMVDGKQVTMTELAAELKVGLGSLRRKICEHQDMEQAIEDWRSSPHYTINKELLDSIQAR